MKRGHKVMSLQTGKVITRPRVKLCKMISSIIASVKATVKKDGIKSLKFFNRKRESILLTPVDLSTGVGKNQDENDSEDSDYVTSSEDTSYDSESNSEMDSNMENKEYQ